MTRDTEVHQEENIKKYTFDCTVLYLEEYQCTLKCGT